VRPQAPELGGFGGKSGMEKQARAGCDMPVMSVADQARVMPCSPGERSAVGLSCATRGAMAEVMVPATKANSAISCARTKPGNSVEGARQSQHAMRQRVRPRRLLTCLYIM
jgi:hypothetical protein